MARLLPAVALVAGLSAATAAAANAQARRIRAQPDPVPAERLRRPLPGDQLVVTAPDGAALQVTVAGPPDGQPVLLAHGYGVTSIEWSLVQELLVDRGFRVITFDQRGHGRSTIGRDGISTTVMAGDYLAVLEAVDARDVVLVGHSMGGFLALAAMLDEPGVAGRVRGLVLFATFAGRVLEGAPQNRLQIPLLRSGVLQAASRNRTVGTLFGASVYGERPSPAAIDVFLETFLAQDHGHLTPILEAFGAEDRYPRLADITVPTVVICGEVDRTTPPHHSEQLAAGIAGARLVTVPGAGHMVNWEAPDTLVDAVVGLTKD